jgi:WD40 repeat protein
MFYVSSHSGVVYDYENRTQLILQGHCNQISCSTVSKDKRWIVTADVGDDNILVVWDSLSGAPVKTIFTPHKTGTICLDISDDALFIATIGAADEVLEKLFIFKYDCL